MGPKRSLGLLVLFACVGLVAAGSTLQVIFKNAYAFQSLNENQQKCGATSYYAAPYESQCEKKECFCASPQFMSDKTDECLIYYEGFYSQKGIYNIDVYNGIMTFFANECGTFEVQSKARIHHTSRRQNSLVSCDESGHTKFPFSSVILSVTTHGPDNGPWKPKAAMGDLS